MRDFIRRPQRASNSTRSGPLVPGRTPAPHSLANSEGAKQRGAVDATTEAVLPDVLRAKYERSLGVDLSIVRVHTDDASAAAARAVNAKAFTVGTEIYFALGRYQPSSRSGEALLAHEIAHAAQRISGKLPAASSDVAEREATAAAQAMVAGRAAVVTAMPPPVACAPEGIEMVSTGGVIAENRHGDIRGIDEMRAALVDAERGLQLSYATPDMIAEAKRLDVKLWRPEVEVGRREKAAIARTLIAMYETLDARLKQAPRDREGYPTVEGIRWDVNDPIGGLLIAVDPFGNVDLWHGFQLAPEEPVHRPARRKTAPTKKPTPEPHVDDKPVFPTPEEYIDRAIGVVGSSNDPWKVRELRMLRLLADPSINDEVLNVQTFLYLNAHYAVPAPGTWEMSTIHVRREFAEWMHRGSSDKDILRGVENLVQLIHYGYYWAKSVEAKYQPFGGGSSASPLERQLFDWIGNHQRDPKSVYSAWVD